MTRPITEPTLRRSGAGCLEDRVTPAAFTLQILHASDFEAGIAAVQDAPNFAAVVDRLEDQSPNSITLASGDNSIPGPFFNAGGDPALNAVLGTASVGRADIEILNRIGVQASAFGNHEFDAGPREVLNIIAPAGAGAAAWRGAQFPYLSSNLTFNGGDLGGRTVPAGTNTGAITPGRIAPSVVVTENGQNIGVIGLTTPLLRSISSPGPNIGVNPADPNDLAALAAIVQQQVTLLQNQGVNVIVLTSHLQQIGVERALAPLLSGVDVIIAGGSNTRLADSTDILRAGESAEGNYPLSVTGADGNATLIVNTDGGYKYVGRLVFTFDDATGLIDPASLNPAVNGAYATDAAGVARVYEGSGLDPFAAGTRGLAVRQVTDAVGNVIRTKDGQIFGQSAVYLNGLRAEVRTEETNLGSVSADANLFAANQAGQAAVVSVKNGGGVRDSIGSVSEAGARDVTVANPDAGKLAGQISRLDIENSLRFNNSLVVVTVPASGLASILEHAVAAVAPGATPGQFGQFGGVRFSYDATRPAQLLAGDTADGIANVTRPGERVRNAAIIDEAGNVVQELIRGGVLVGDPARPIRIVTLNFLADEGTTVDGLGGDGYPIPSFDSNRVDLFDGQGNKLGEQQGFINYLTARFPVGGAAITFADTPANRDGRIQNLALRADTVLTGALTPTVTPNPVTLAEDTEFGLIVITPNAANGAEVTHFSVFPYFGVASFAAVGAPQIKGALFFADGVTPVQNRGIITVAQGAAGLIFRPFANANGTTEVTVQPSTSGTPAGISSKTVTVPVTLTPVNDAPTAADLTLTTAEETTVTGKIVAADVDGDALTYTFALTAPPSFFTGSLSADGTFSFTPRADFTGTPTFSVVVSDNNGGRVFVTVTVTVTPVNDAPTAGNVTRTTAEDAAVNGSVAAADVEGDALTFALASGPAVGTAVVNADGSFTYTPPADFSGSTSFRVSVSDGGGGVATSEDTVTVTPVNDAPTAPATAAISVSEDGTIGGSLAASDLDGGVPTFALTTAPASGVAVVNANGTFTYTPNANFNGTDLFVVTVSDGNNGVTTTRVNVTVTPVNDAPTAANDRYTANAGGAALTVAGPGVLGNDADTEGTALTAALSVSPLAGEGVLDLRPDGTFTFTPAAGFVGTATFTYRATDGSLFSTPATVAIVVPAPVVLPPLPPAIDRPTDQNETGVFAAASGADGTVVLFDASGNETLRLQAFPPAEAPGGVRAVVADFTGDGVPDFAVGTGPGVPTAVRIYDGVTQKLVSQVAAFEASFVGGVQLAAADFDGDGRAELVVTADNGGGPRVRVLSGDGRTVRADFLGIDDPAFRGGARATTGDLNGDGTPDLIVAAGFGGGPRVAAFDGRRLFAPTAPGQLPPKLFGDVFLFEPGLRDGAFVAAGDIDGDGADDLVGGGGPGGGPRVFGLSGAGLTAGRRDQVVNFFAGDPADASGLRVAAKDLDGDRFADLVVAPGAGKAAAIRAFRGRDLTPTGTPPSVEDLFPFGSDFAGGVFVG